MFRGAEPLGGVAARRRKRASRGYMVPFARVEHGLALWQHPLPQSHVYKVSPCQAQALWTTQGQGLLLGNNARRCPCPAFAL